MDAVALLRLGYLSAALLVVVIALIPSLNKRFLAYGARSSDNAAMKQEPSSPSTEPAWMSKLLHLLASITVPHSWFASFYVLLVLSLLFWAQQLLSHGPVFLSIADATNSRPISTSMTPCQILINFLGLSIQGIRRVNESFAPSKPSSSRMWFGHWALGILFYLATSIAIWIEGLPVLLTHTYSWNDLYFTAPTFRTFVSMILFLMASGIQHDCHAYLDSIKPATATANRPANQYVLPQHPAFANVVAPHYGAEVVIYVALMLGAAPRGAWVNWTMACALVFVGVNLGVTAEGTRRWYQGRFGRASVAGKWRMLPRVF